MSFRKVVFWVCFEMITSLERTQDTQLDWHDLLYVERLERRSRARVVEEELLIRVVFWLLELHYNGCLPVKMDFTRFSSATLWNVVTWATIFKKLFLRSYNVVLKSRIPMIKLNQLNLNFESGRFVEVRFRESCVYFPFTSVMSFWCIKVRPDYALVFC